MKPIPIAVAQDYDAGTTHAAHVLILERLDGYVVGLTSYTRDQTVNGVNCTAGIGLEVSSTVVRSGVAVDNLELTTINDGSVFVENDILAGRWKGARFLLGKYNFLQPAGGVDITTVGVLGTLQVNQLNGTVVGDLRGLQQFLQQQTVSSVLTKTCRARFGDDKCRAELGTYTFNGMVDSAAAQQSFQSDMVAGRPDDYFGNGELQWTGGDNAGLKATVKSSVSGVIVLQLPMLYPVVVGDTFTVVAGCRKRLDEDCFEKFDNVINFQGEPHVPGIDHITKSA